MYTLVVLRHGVAGAIGARCLGWPRHACQLADDQQDSLQHNRVVVVTEHLLHKRCLEAASLQECMSSALQN